jgi:hypothetical protein
MSSDTPNAVYARPGPSWRERRYPPRHAPVWVRLEGAWREGIIQYWVTIDPVEYGWECQVEVEARRSGGRSARYVFDEQAIRPRYGPDPPAESAVRTGLKPTELESGTVYVVKSLDVTGPGRVLGCVQQIPEGWRRYGYGDSVPVLATSAEAVDDLIRCNSHELETGDPGTEGLTSA